MGNDPHGIGIDAVILFEQPGRDPGHHDNAPAACRKLADDPPRRRLRLREEGVEGGHDRLCASRREVEDSAAPVAWIEPELVLEVDDVAGAVVGNLGGERIGLGATVVDDMRHPRIAGGDGGDPLDRRNRRHGLPGGQIDRIGGVFGEGRQPARLGGIGGDKKRAHGVKHRSPPGGWLHRRPPRRPGSQEATATECRTCRPEWPARVNRDQRVAMHPWISKRSTGSQSEGLRGFVPEYRSLHPPDEELTGIIRPATPTNKQRRPARHDGRSISAGLHRHVGINRCGRRHVPPPALPSAAACPSQTTVWPKNRSTSPMDSAAGGSPAVTRSADRQGSAVCRQAACRHRPPHVRHGHGALTAASRQGARG